MKRYDRIVITGSIAYDEIMDFPGKFIDYLQKDKLHQINVSFVVDKLEKQLGGVATNISYNLSLLTKNPVRIIGAVGKDGYQFVDFFKKNKIDVSSLYIDRKLYTSTGKVITDIKDNQIWGYYYGASKEAKILDLTRSANKKTIIILGANHFEAFLKFQKQCIENKYDYLYDPGMVLTWIKKEDLKKGVYNSKFLIGNDYEISAILKKIGSSISDLLKKNISVIVTLGEKGVNFFGKNESYRVGAVKVKKVVDPTGAGDAWRGGFVASLVEGKKIIECLKMGNALASFAIEKYGTVNHRPTRQDLAQRIIKIV